MSRKDREEYIDDGRTIAPMDVPGMPWHIEKEKVKATDEQLPELSKEGSRALMRGVALAALSICAVFAVIYLLFILFCYFIWFK